MPEGQGGDLLLEGDRDRASATLVERLAHLLLRCSRPRRRDLRDEKRGHVRALDRQNPFAALDSGPVMAPPISIPVRVADLQVLARGLAHALALQGVLGQARRPAGS